MNKFGIVLGAAAVVTLAGCKDPNYKYAGPATTSQSEVKNVQTTEKTEVEKPSETVPEAKCQCVPGTKHESPCACGAADCSCVVEKKKPTPPPVPAEPVYTEYIVQEGDYLAKISKRYNVTIASIRRLNPSIKKDVIRLGQKIKLPGKIDVGAQKVPTTAKPTAKRVSATTSSYTGPTKEYVVKNGDTLGAIAYGNGINIRQLKKLNNLTSDMLKIGQKLKIPAAKVVSAPVAKVVSAPVAKEPVVAPKAEVKDDVAAPVAEPVTEAPMVEETMAPAVPVETTTVAEATTPATTTPAAPETMTYVVKEGEDMTSVAIHWGVSAAEIRELNNLGDNDQLVPGQVIKLPAEAKQ